MSSRIQQVLVEVDLGKTIAEIIASTISTIEEWMPTGALRWADVSGHRILQQEWIERRTGRRQWRNIPNVIMDADQLARESA